MRTSVVAILTMALACAQVAYAASDTTKRQETGPTLANGTQTTVQGMLAVKANGASSNVVCRLMTGYGTQGRVYNLIASGELAKTIAARREEGDKVKVMGTVKGDNLTVTSIEKVVLKKGT